MLPFNHESLPKLSLLILSTKDGVVFLTILLAKFNRYPSLV